MAVAYLIVTAHSPLTVGLLTDVAVIVAVPSATPVTLPNAETVATFVSLEDHVTLVSEAFSGVTEAVNVSLSLGSNAKVVLLIATAVTATVSLCELGLFLEPPPLLVPPQAASESNKAGNKISNFLFFIIFLLLAFACLLYKMIHGFLSTFL